MKTFVTAAALAAAIFGAAPAMAQTNVSISVGQPGFYGRIDVGDFAQPQLVYAQPVVIERTRYVGAPVYLRVPPGHRKNWNKHCRAYNACGQQVYFVRDDWYANTYAPRYREQHYRVAPREVRYERDGRDGRDGHDERRGHDDEHDNGHGHGNGHGNGHGKHGD